MQFSILSLGAGATSSAAAAQLSTTTNPNSISHTTPPVEGDILQPRQTLTTFSLIFITDEEPAKPSPTSTTTVFIVPTTTLTSLEIIPIPIEPTTTSFVRLPPGQPPLEPTPSFDSTYTLTVTSTYHECVCVPPPPTDAPTPMFSTVSGEQTFTIARGGGGDESPTGRSGEGEDGEESGATPSVRHSLIGIAGLGIYLALSMVVRYTP